METLSRRPPTWEGAKVTRHPCVLAIQSQEGNRLGIYFKEMHWTNGRQVPEVGFIVDAFVHAGSDMRIYWTSTG